MATVIRRRGGSDQRIADRAEQELREAIREAKSIGMDLGQGHESSPDSKPPPEPRAEPRKRLLPRTPGVEGEGDWQAWLRKLEAANAWFGSAAYRAQILAAEKVADILRDFLARGVQPELSRMTIALAGRHPPLATLARHVVVVRPRQNRVPKGMPGAGQFAAQFRPAVITFEKGWAQKAFVLEHGRAWEVPAKVRRALIMKAIEKGFQLEEGMSTGGVWVIPPRPFMHVLEGPEATAAMRKIAEDVFSGKDVVHEAKRPAWMDVLEEDPDGGGQPTFVNWEDVEAVMSDPNSTDFEDLVEFEGD